jgi:hypothetical protein
MLERTFPRNDVLGPKSTLTVVVQWNALVTEMVYPNINPKGACCSLQRKTPKCHTAHQTKNPWKIPRLLVMCRLVPIRTSQEGPGIPRRVLPGHAGTKPVCVRGRTTYPGGRYSRDQLQPVGEHFVYAGQTSCPQQCWCQVLPTSDLLPSQNGNPDTEGPR